MRLAYQASWPTCCLTTIARVQDFRAAADRRRINIESAIPSGNGHVRTYSLDANNLLVLPTAAALTWTVPSLPRRRSIAALGPLVVTGPYVYVQPVTAVELRVIPAEVGTGPVFSRRPQAAASHSCIPLLFRIRSHKLRRHCKWRGNAADVKYLPPPASTAVHGTIGTAEYFGAHAANFPGGELDVAAVIHFPSSWATREYYVAPVTQTLGTDSRLMA